MSRQHVSAALVFAALSIAMTWPLLPNLGTAVSDPGDPYINTWILDWDWWATLHQPLTLFDANALYPARLTLAFSEHLYGIALLLFPLRVIGVPPLAAHNVAMLMGFGFCGFAMYLLAWRLTRSWAAAVAAGVFYAFVPFRFTHLPHVQHVWGGWLPLMLLMLLLYAAEPARRYAIAFAVMFALNGLTNVHYLFFGAFACGVTAVLVVPKRAWRELAIATACACAVLVPFLVPYALAAKQYGLQRTWEETWGYSAYASDWIAAWVAQPERRLYPGALALIVAALALIVARRERPKLLLGLLWIAIGFCGSLGLHFEFHRFLFGAVPGFRAIRVPARWAVIAYVGLAILIALFTAVVERKHRRAALLVPLAFTIALWQAPIRWYLAAPAAPVYAWLAQGPRTPIIELPIEAENSEYRAYLHATVHHRPMVNGIPVLPERASLAAKFNPAVADDFVDALHAIAVDLIVVHADLLGARAEEIRAWLRRELARGRLAYVADFDTSIDGDWVFRVAPRTRAANPPRLESFLRGEPRCGASMMGALDVPSPGTAFRYDGMFSGWAISPYGIRSVDIYLENRRVHYAAHLGRDAGLDARCPGDERYARKRFVLVLPARPAAVRRDTDVQVDITDERGVTTSLEDRWLRWE
ncbi:MAG: hypothetical protein JO197_08395 [Acidobacteria bacterium]|nr:hypothetical protein [Acidobacteriota bacterium]MBV9474640.1 hypothetical protein [Acidobacteriota bacterium]